MRGIGLPRTSAGGLARALDRLRDPHSWGGLQGTAAGEASRSFALASAFANQREIRPEVGVCARALKERTALFCSLFTDQW